MKQFEDHFEWYRFGLIHRIRSFRDGDLVKNRLYDLHQCALRLAVFVDSPLNQERLPGSVKAANTLLDHLGAYLGVQIREEQDADTKVIANEGQLNRTLNELET